MSRLRLVTRVVSGDRKGRPELNLRTAEGTAAPRTERPAAGHGGLNAGPQVGEPGRAWHNAHS